MCTGSQPLTLVAPNHATILTFNFGAIVQKTFFVIYLCSTSYHNSFLPSFLSFLYIPPSDKSKFLFVLLVKELIIYGKKVLKSFETHTLSLGI